MIFDVRHVEYPVRFANLQGNSLVPVKTRASLQLSWSKGYAEVNENFVLTPHAVLLSGGIVGVVASNNVLLYDTAGNFRFLEATASLAPAVFGPKAMACVRPSFLLKYQDYDRNQLGEPGIAPKYKEWTIPLLFKPGLEELLGAFQFTGGPERQPPRYYVYRYLIKGGNYAWKLDEAGVMDRALLSQDGATLILLQKGEVRLVNVAAGTAGATFTTGLERVLTAAVDPSSNVIVLGQTVSEKGPKSMLKAFTLAGKELWACEAVEPQVSQPPACGSDGRVYLVDSLQLKCIIKGQVAWAQPLKSAESTWLTITADNHAVVVNGSLLSLFDPDGDKLFERQITKESETFNAPAAIDAKGRIYVAGNERLYCFE